MATYSTITQSDIVVWVQYDESGGDFRIPGSVTTRMVINSIVGNRVNLSLRSLASDSVLAFYQLPMSDIIFCLTYLSYKTYSEASGGGGYGGEYGGGGGPGGGGFVYP